MGEPVTDYAIRAPHPRLRPFVQQYSGYRLSGFEPGTHAGLPSQSLTFIVAFDNALDVSTHGLDDRTRYWGMLGGLHARPATVYHDGNQHGVQLAVTPPGAEALFGVPAGELASTVVHLDDVAPTVATELIERLSAAATWRTRWAVLDEILCRMVREEVALAPELERAWQALTSSHGAIGVAELADDVGWSRRHFGLRFRETFGLPPKVMARVLRFERAQRLLRLPTQPSLASVASACGYADQAHMTRDWREFSGSTPSAWLNDENLPFVQDDGDGEPSR